MGIQISGTTSRVTHTFKGRTFPEFVTLPDPWEFGVHMSSATARSFLGLLELPFEPEGLCGACTLPEARRAVMRARATFERKVDNFTVKSETFYSSPRQNNNGAIELRPFRGHDFGVDADRLHRQLERFAEFIEIAAQAGADGFSWG